MYSMKQEVLSHVKRVAIMLEMHDAILGAGPGGPIARPALTQTESYIDDTTLFLEASDFAYACLWRAYPPFFADSLEWRIDMWMLRESQKNRRCDFDMLALRTLAATSPPYRSVEIPLDISSGTLVREFALALWGAMDVARACREIENAVKKQIPMLPDIIIEHFHRGPDDEITWMTGLLGAEKFVLHQYGGSRRKTVLKLGGDGEESRSYETLTAEGWYGNQILVNSLEKIANEMTAAGDEQLSPLNSPSCR